MAPVERQGQRDARFGSTAGRAALASCSGYGCKMTGLQLRELRLAAFKSYRDAVVPLSPLTVLIGRNGSGKSNTLDALEILARLAAGDEVRDALDGGRKDQSAIRGGAEGCAPDGGDSFTLGITVGDAAQYEESTRWATLDVTVQVRPDVRIVAESFSAYLPQVRRLAQVLLSTDPDPHRSDLFAQVFNNKRGANPSRAFRSSHLLTSQLALRLEGAGRVEADILAVSEDALAAISGVFQLDPVPHLMRDYVPEQDSVLRRTADNLSATVAAMKREDPERFSEIVSIVKLLPENEIRGIEMGRGTFGEVMIALKERRGRASVAIPARQMSDGMLRMLAIATALLTGGRGLAVEPAPDGVDAPSVCLVLEELENGLHPSQAERVLTLVREAVLERGLQVVMTTHSPALLNALEGDDHPGVLVCERNRTTGVSSVRRLVDLPGYLAMMARGRLGDAVTAGAVADAGQDRAAVDLHALLGIG